MSETFGLWLLAVGFLSLFFGYSVGRRTGRREGLLEGMAFAPLEMRRRSWERGTCLICGTVAGGETEDEWIDQKAENEVGQQSAEDEPVSEQERKHMHTSE